MKTFNDLIEDELLLEEIVNINKQFNYTLKEIHISKKDIIIEFFTYRTYNYSLVIDTDLNICSSIDLEIRPVLNNFKIKFLFQENGYLPVPKKIMRSIKIKEILEY